MTRLVKLDKQGGLLVLMRILGPDEDFEDVLEDIGVFRNTSGADSRFIARAREEEL